MLELINSSNAKNAINDVKEAIMQAPDSAEAYLCSLAHKYAKKAHQEASKLFKAAELEESKAKTPNAKSAAQAKTLKAKSEAKTLEDAVFENFKELLSRVSLHTPLKFAFQLNCFFFCG